MTSSKTGQITIRSIGAGGDGVANLPDGQIYVPFTLPGEVVNVARDKNRATLMALLEASPERQNPACRHFEDCGGCALQHWQDEPYRLWKRELVVGALKGRGTDVEVAPLVACNPHTRRRAVFAARKTEKGVLLGCNRHQSHEIIDIVECPVTVPEIIARLDDLREVGALLAPGSGPFKLAATLTESGLDLAASGCGKLNDEQRRALTALVIKKDFARLSHEGEIIVEPKKPLIHFGKVPVPVPPGCFLQATAEAEETMAALVLAHLGKARRVADLFCGVGTFALRIAEKSAVHAVENDAAALAALDRGVRHVQGLKPVSIERRDLFRRPLMTKELLPYNAVVFDPPRAGAEEQALELAKSKVEKVVAISCNPVTLARDLAILQKGGYRIERVTPIDQFLWSAHVEAVAVLTKGRQ
ncbi:class I SAM-dependent RNA methyltransferase [Brucella melitensis]|uniref:class I SAM-dependent RNA methyltransferase n=1 Tax=Brucella melitensis TaxID=29459 RepID=UPI0001B59387|nr:class I SAM-dependent RNA methyltransferase [Brucella melitensis]AIJ85220.1 methyltransferase small domain protein [Brucella melitensis bv. 3 str. Ether]AOG49281.1 RNA methyltransferase [Brucella melitensis]ARY24098.1 RNA methyltransferase [Brucella melitensis]ARY27258.1 RNA methyltransferase [Brucella melitensis]ARY36743.1 RNA methyltransferase [Brucella melitensis]